MSAVGFGAVLLGLWVLLWGSLSVANVVSGLLVVGLVLWLVPDVTVRLGRPVVRPVALARFVARLLVEVVRANAVLTREIVSRGSTTRTGVVAVPLPRCSDGLITLVANVLALTPGTMPVEVRKAPDAAVYVHVLHLRDVEDVRRDVQSLADLAVRAFGSAEAVAALARADATPHDTPTPDEAPTPIAATPDDGSTPDDGPADGEVGS